MSWARQQIEITHGHLDTLPQSQSVHHIRELLIGAGVLARRQEGIAQLQLWAVTAVSSLPPHHQQVIRAYVEWHVLRRARRRAKRRGYRRGAADSARHRVTIAIDFLAWLDSIGTHLSDLTQEHVDTWLDANPTKRHQCAGFFSWLEQRHLIRDIKVTRPKYSLPQRFQHTDDATDQLERCLTDDTLPLVFRIAGALVRLYALPLVRIVELTVDRFYRDDTYAYLIVDKNPIVLPPSLATLIEQQIQQTASAAKPNTNPAGSPYLVPGRLPSRPRSVAGLAVKLAKHGLPALAARNTAIMTSVTELDAIVVADLFGIHPSTAHRWAAYAQTSWAEFLACAAEETATSSGDAINDQS
ncbi:hypothetical protein [Nocardia sp. NPDC049707]|uniref:hypothetical protein n=1 Tax=Nocardia sp. NPDC049707 TaxID=3154735 RepID=UPI003417F24E